MSQNNVNVIVEYFFLQYVLPMELITSDSFGKWMQVFQSVVNREVPQVRILLIRQQYFHVEILHVEICAPFN